MKCPFPKCRTGDLPVDPKNVVEHLIVTKDEENHFHVHAPISNKALIQDFVVFILKEAGIAYNIVPEPQADTVPKDNKKED